MADLITLIAVLVVWGLIPASVHFVLQFLMRRETDKIRRAHLERQRLWEWRTRIPYVTPDWPREAHMDTVASHTIYEHVHTAHEDAFAYEAMIVGQEAAHALRATSHIRN